MKRRTALAGIAGASGLLAVAALVSPVVTNAATPTDRSGTAPHTASSAATAKSTPHRLTSARAGAIVRKQANGGRVTDVRGLRHGGYDAFAVRIARTDGSTLTGYVDRDSGVVFDWKQTVAPLGSQAAMPSSTTSDDNESAEDNGIGEQGDNDDADSEGASDQQGDDNHQDGYSDQQDDNDHQGENSQIDD